MFKRYNIFLLPGYLILVGCDSSVLWKDYPYEVHWIDTYNNRSLAYSLDNVGSIGRVEAEEIAVGSNKYYVVAKQRISGQTAINYYYIDRIKDSKHLNWNEITEGPFTEVKFKELTMHLNLPDFSEEFQ